MVQTESVSGLELDWIGGPNRLTAYRYYCRPIIVHLNWAQNSVKISPECINFSFQKFFWGGGTAPSPYLTPDGEGDTPSPYSTPSWPSATRPSWPGATRSATQISPPQSFSNVGAYDDRGRSIHCRLRRTWVNHEVLLDWRT